MTHLFHNIDDNIKKGNKQTNNVNRILSNTLYDFSFMYSVDGYFHYKVWPLSITPILSKYMYYMTITNIS